jgi:hypothetical protein
MSRPEFITYEDTVRWDEQIKHDNIEEEIAEEPLLIEVIYAGLWLVEELIKLKCPQDYIIRIQYTAGAASFGRDPWELHQYYLDAYKNNELEFDQDLDNLN